MTSTGTFKECAADAESCAIQCEEIDSPYDDVAPEMARVDRFTPEKIRNHSKMLSLNQRHLPLASQGSGKVIAGQARAGPRFDLLDADQSCVAGGPHANPLHDTSLRDARK
jgi:hypothetical protein